MQSRLRNFIPALVALIVHAALLIGLLSLGGTPPPDHVETDALPVIWIEAARRPEHTIGAPGQAPMMTPPAITLPQPEIQITPGPIAPSDGLSALGRYIACGLGQAVTAEEREHCEKLRGDLSAGRDAPKGSTAYDLDLERRFAREKAAQDAPVLLPCFTPAGPNLFCLLGGALNGFEFEMGSYADNGRRENPLAQPVLPYRPK